MDTNEHELQPPETDNYAWNATLRHGLGRNEIAALEFEPSTRQQTNKQKPTVS
jgi:hypothetical protein